MTAYAQTITPTPDIPCTPGWCLQYVREAFGLPARYASATEAWESSVTQHLDRDLPAGCWVPVWYAVDGVPEGHVVLYAPDGSVYSTTDPGTNTPHHHPSLADLEAHYAYYGPALTWRGWTEDVAGSTVLTPLTITTKGEVIAVLDTEIQAIAAAVLDAVATDPATGNTYTLRDTLAVQRQRDAEVVAATVHALLFTQFPRLGPDVSGMTDLFSVLSWSDQNNLHPAAQTGPANPVDLVPAIKAALATLTLKASN